MPELKPLSCGKGFLFFARVVLAPLPVFACHLRHRLMPASDELAKNI